MHVVYIEDMKVSKDESIQRRATKFILCLPFLTNISYKERLMSVNLLPGRVLLAQVTRSSIILQGYA